MRDPFRYMCCERKCPAFDIPNIAKVYQHVSETGHEVYQYVMINGKAQLTAIIDEKIVKGDDSNEGS